MKSLFVAIPVALAFLGTSYGATLRFNLNISNIGGGVLSNIADENDDTTDGLQWGILVAESGTTFPSALTDLGLNAVDGAELAPGYRYFNGGLTTSFGVSLDFPPNAGVISASSEIDATSFNPGVDAGDSFALIWFERGFSGAVSQGVNYGLLENAGLTLPSDGNTGEFDSLFVGDDPLRSADLIVVPEPTTAILASLGMLGLLRRRR